jgi:hypothetical protein
MNNIINDITHNFLQKLPENKEYFTPGELLEYGIPDFVVKRIELVLHDNLNNNLSIPETDWADSNTEKVHHAWNVFLDEIEENKRLPRSYASSIFESVVEEIMTILVEPGLNIPEVIFGDEMVLSVEKVAEQSKKIVVYQHLVQALQRYIHRKGLDELTKERCIVVIEQIDQKFTERYSPLNWIQLFAPWFTLMGDKVETELLRRFFEEKGINEWADRFDKEEDFIDGEKLLETLSASTEDNRPQQIEMVDSKEFNQEPNAEEPENQETLNKQDKPNNSLKNGEQSERESDHIQVKSNAKNEQNGDEEVPIWQRFILDDTNEETLVNKISNQSPSSGVDEDENEDEEEESQSRTLADILAEKANREYDAEDEEDSDEAEEKPIIDLYEDDTDEKSKNFEELYYYIKDQKDYFINNLFGGEENAFLQAIEDIAKYSKWSDASRYISNEIFRRNMIDIYSEVAIDFTDSLQSYFLEN